MATDTSSLPTSQTYIYAIAVAGTLLLQGFWPALTPLLGILRWLSLLGILVCGPLELYHLCRTTRQSAALR